MPHKKRKGPIHNPAHFHPFKDLEAGQPSIGWGAGQPTVNLHAMNIRSGLFQPPETNILDSTTGTVLNDGGCYWALREEFLPKDSIVCLDMFRQTEALKKTIDMIDMASASGLFDYDLLTGKVTYRKDRR